MAARTLLLKLERAGCVRLPTSRNPTCGRTRNDRHKRIRVPVKDVYLYPRVKEFDGVLGCDYFSAYHKCMRDFNVTVQFCIAHPIRDIKFLTGLPDAETRAYGRRRLAAVKALCPRVRTRTARRCSAKPSTWPGVSARTAKPASSSSPRPASAPPTTWPSRPACCRQAVRAHIRGHHPAPPLLPAVG